MSAGTGIIGKRKRNYNSLKYRVAQTDYSLLFVKAFWLILVVAFVILGVTGKLQTQGAAFKLKHPLDNFGSAGGINGY